MKHFRSAAMRRARAIAFGLLLAGVPPAPGRASPPPDRSRPILTPPPSSSPRINGAKIFGVRPGAPFLFKVAATGAKPLEYAASGLPTGLGLDRHTGLISGRLSAPGTHRVLLRVRNASGMAERPLRIVVGEEISLTPPMGWNSWYSWSESVSQANVTAATEAMVATGLIDHGWSYINLDDCWQGVRGGPHGAIQPNGKFPDIAALSARIHALGLKFGLYSTIWMGSYAGFIGGSAPSPDGDYSSLDLVPSADRLQPAQIFGRYPGSIQRQAAQAGPFMLTDRDAWQYAEWGVDFVKYDWRNWRFTEPPGPANPKRELRPKSSDSIDRLARELRATGRDIVLSLSPISDVENREQLPRQVQLWRITKDITPSWEALSLNFELGDWHAFTRPGHWCDPDMLQIGAIGVPNARNRTLKPTPLTPDEQYTQMSLWCLLAAPLLLSCDLVELDPFTLGLISNDEVIDIDQDPLGVAAKRVHRSGDTEVWRKPLEDGSIAVGLFNRGPTPARMTATWSDLGLAGPQRVRDLWRQRDVASDHGPFVADVASHGVVLVRIAPAR